MKKLELLEKLLVSQSDGGLNFNFRCFALRSVVGNYRNFFIRVKKCTGKQLQIIYQRTLELTYRYNHGLSLSGFEFNI